MSPSSPNDRHQQRTAVSSSPRRGHRTATTRSRQRRREHHPPPCEIQVTTTTTNRTSDPTEHATNRHHQVRTAAHVERQEESLISSVNEEEDSLHQQQEVSGMSVPLQQQEDGDSEGEACTSRSVRLCPWPSTLPPPPEPSEPPPLPTELISILLLNHSVGSDDDTKRLPTHAEEETSHDASDNLPTQPATARPQHDDESPVDLFVQACLPCEDPNNHPLLCHKDDSVDGVVQYMKHDFAYAIPSPNTDATTVRSVRLQLWKVPRQQQPLRSLFSSTHHKIRNVVWFLQVSSLSMTSLSAVLDKIRDCKKQWKEMIKSSSSSAAGSDHQQQQASICSCQLVILLDTAVRKRTSSSVQLLLLKWGIQLERACRHHNFLQWHLLPATPTTTEPTTTDSNNLQKLRNTTPYHGVLARIVEQCWQEQQRQQSVVDAPSNEPTEPIRTDVASTSGKGNETSASSVPALATTPVSSPQRSRKTASTMTTTSLSTAATILTMAVSP